MGHHASELTVSPMGISGLPPRAQEVFIVGCFSE